MDKLEMQTANFTDENIEKLAGLFPNCVTEAKDATGKLKKAIDFDLLKQELSENIVDGPRERYQINWPGKKEALISANTPINKTLRPCREESVDFDTTENLYIEGDNLEALKLLQESYLGKVKMIYIDPPYNTGNDFVYNDNFTRSQEEELQASEQVDEDGGRLVANLESNGRFHSDWMSMIYPRLKLARNLLKDEGSIFISIDNNEIDNLKKICDEVFGSENFVSTITNANNPKGRSDDKFIAIANEYILIYTKDKSKLSLGGFEPDDKIIKRYNKLDIEGFKYREIDLRKTGDSDRRQDRPNMFYYFYYDKENDEIFVSKEKLIDIDKKIEIIPLKDNNEEGRWRWGYDNAAQNLNKLKAKFMPNRNIWGIVEKDYLNERAPVTPTTLWTFKDLNSERGSEQFINLGFNKEVFSRPKPIGTIVRSSIVADISNDDIVLDFFSGSATTAHAIMYLNANDNCNRKYIMVQLPEETDEKSEAYKAGYKTIPEIGRERIRRAGKKIKEENADKEGIEDLDIGFRVLKIDNSNMKDVYYTPDQMSQSLLDSQEQNIKEDRTAEDLLFQVLLDWGVDLSLPIRREEIQGKTVYFVDEDTLVACFDDDLDAEFAKEIAKRKPLRAVFKESGYKQDEDKINIDQVIKQFSPDTEVRAI